jgi:hypothetical protein
MACPMTSYMNFGFRASPVFLGRHFCVEVAQTRHLWLNTVVVQGRISNPQKSWGKKRTLLFRQSYSDMVLQWGSFSVRCNFQVGLHSCAVWKKINLIIWTVCVEMCLAVSWMYWRILGSWFHASWFNVNKKIQLDATIRRHLFTAKSLYISYCKMQS